MHLNSLLKSMLVTVFLLLVFSMTLGILYFYSSFSSKLLGYLISFVIATAFLLGGFTSGYLAGENGLLHGISTAIILIIMVLLANRYVTLNLNWHTFLINSLFALLAASIGSIIGVSKN